MAWDRRVPYDEKGNLMGYADTGYYKAAEWRIQHEFDATLKFLKYGRGRSAAYFLFEDTETGKTYPVTMGDFCDRVLRKLEPEGIVSGRWLEAKHGQNFSIQRIGDKKGSGT